MSKTLALRNVDATGAHLLAAAGLDEPGQAIAQQVASNRPRGRIEDHWACDNCHGGNPHRLKRCADCGTSRY